MGDSDAIYFREFRERRDSLVRGRFFGAGRRTDGGGNEARATKAPQKNPAHLCARAKTAPLEWASLL